MRSRFLVLALLTLLPADVVGRGAAVAAEQTRFNVSMFAVDDLRRHLPDVVTLPQQFKAQGYHTYSLSKVFHNGLDDARSWSEKSWFPSAPSYGKPETLESLRAEAARLKAEHKGPASKVLERDPKTGTVLKTTPPAYRARGPAWEDPQVADPQENVNLASSPKHKSLVEQLSEQLAGGWKAARPVH